MCVYIAAWKTSVCRFRRTSSPTPMCGATVATCGLRPRRRQSATTTRRRHCAARHYRTTTGSSRPTAASTSIITTITIIASSSSISSSLHHRLTTSQTSRCLASPLEHNRTFTGNQSRQSWGIVSQLLWRIGMPTQTTAAVLFFFSMSALGIRLKWSSTLLLLDYDKDNHGIPTVNAVRYSSVACINYLLNLFI